MNDEIFIDSNHELQVRFFPFQIEPNKDELKSQMTAAHPLLKDSCSKPPTRRLESLDGTEAHMSGTEFG